MFKWVEIWNLNCRHIEETHIKRRWAKIDLKLFKTAFSLQWLFWLNTYFYKKYFQFVWIFPPWRSKSKKIPRVFAPKSLWNHGEMILHIQGYSPNSGHTYLWLEVNFLFSLEMEPFSRTPPSHHHFHKTNPKIYIVSRCQDILSSFPI